MLAVEGEALRWPWTTCPSAVEPLRGLAGAPLQRRSTALGSYAEARSNCTHLFDLAGLAAAHAAAGRQARDYEVEVPDRVAGRTTARLWRDRVPALTWTVEGMTISDPAPFVGVRLRGSFLRWAEEHLDEDAAEAAIVLRRACEISMGRMQDLESLEVAGDLGVAMMGSCHTFQPGTVDVALRVKGTLRDFSDDPEGLLT